MLGILSVTITDRSLKETALSGMMDTVLEKSFRVSFIMGFLVKVRVISWLVFSI